MSEVPEQQSQNEKARQAQAEKIKGHTLRPSTLDSKRRTSDCKLCNGTGVKGKASATNLSRLYKPCKCARR
jgi:hypothetical protein